MGTSCMYRTWAHAACYIYDVHHNTHLHGNIILLKGHFLQNMFSKNTDLYRKGNRGGSVGGAFDSGPICCRFGSHPWN